MTLLERKSLVVNSIRSLEGQLISLQSIEYDGVRSFEERQLELRGLEHHLFWANKALLLINEEELEVV